MRFIKDQDLSEIHKYTFSVSAQLGEKFSQNITDIFTKLFNEDETFGELTYSGALSTILKANNIIFFRLIEYAHFIGKHFPDSENNLQELFEECIAGLRILTSFSEPNKKEHSNGIKKIEVSNVAMDKC